MGASPIPATGVAWDEAVPDNGQPHGNDFNEHHETKKAIRIRMCKEHVAFDADSVGGEHKAGSAVAYYGDYTTSSPGDSLPATKPDGATALDSDDAGRLAYDSGIGLLSMYSGSAWVGLGVPAGAIIPFGGATAPSGWLLCNGAAVSRSTYAALYSMIGTNYGSGDGSTTFNLPDLRGRIPVGKSTDTEFDTLGETGGEKTHLLTSAESGLPAHDHDINYSLSGGSGSYSPVVDGDGNTEDAANTTAIQNNTAADASSAHNNLQPYQVVNYIIKY